MEQILLFDVNETLLDLSALDSQFKHFFHDASVRQQWFSQFIQSALVSIITNSYTPFGKIGSAALDMISERKGIHLSDADKNAILSGLINLPLHKEVAYELARLKNKGFIIATLTNSTNEVVKMQLKNAGIIQFFDKIISADEVKRLKPAREVYEYAANVFDVSINNTMLIASHAWDIAGALHAGCSTAFIARPGMILDPLVKKPNIIGKDLTEIVEQIIEIKAL